MNNDLTGDITIVIPVWDSYVQHLPNLIVALREEIGGAHIIVVDNASKTDLPPVDAETLQLPHRVSVGEARNAALPQVKTSYVSFFDADDLPVPGSLLVLTNMALETRVVVCAGTWEAWNPTTTKTVPIKPSKRIVKLSTHPKLFALASVVRNRYGVIGAVLHTNSVREAGGFSPHNYCEDWALGTALAFRGRILLVPLPALRVRVHVGSVIHREGTAWGILTSLRMVHKRWMNDPVIPKWLPLIFPVLSVPRLKQAAKRFATRSRSHDDLIEKLNVHET